MSAEDTLKTLGLVVPRLEDLYRANISGAHYISHFPVQGMLYLSGTVPIKDGKVYLPGVLGENLTIEQGYEAARQTAIAMLSTLKAELGDLKKVRRIVKVLGLVNCTDSFTEHPKVINGFSDLMVGVFGEKGKHARSAVGASSLPLNIAVEVEMIVEVE